MATGISSQCLGVEPVLSRVSRLQSATGIKVVGVGNRLFPQLFMGLSLEPDP